VDLERLLVKHRTAIRDIVERHGASGPRIFGSAARGESRLDSDLDILVTPGPKFSLFDHIAIKQDLEALLGIRVDVATEGGLHWTIRDKVLSESVPL